MLDSLITLQDDIAGFLDVGGDVMVGIYWATFLMWALITERYLYFGFRHPEVVADLNKQWRIRKTGAAWAVGAARDQISSLNRQSATSTLGLMHTFAHVRCMVMGPLFAH